MSVRSRTFVPCRVQLMFMHDDAEVAGSARLRVRAHTLSVSGIAHANEPPEAPSAYDLKLGATFIDTLIET